MKELKELEKVGKRFTEEPPELNVRNVLLLVVVLLVFCVCMCMCKKCLKWCCCGSKKGKYQDDDVECEEHSSLQEARDKGILTQSRSFESDGSLRSLESGGGPAEKTWANTCFFEEGERLHFRRGGGWEPCHVTRVRDRDGSMQVNSHVNRWFSHHDQLSKFRRNRFSLDCPVEYLASVGRWVEARVENVREKDGAIQLELEDNKHRWFLPREQEEMMRELLEDPAESEESAGIAEESANDSKFRFQASPSASGHTLGVSAGNPLDESDKAKLMFKNRDPSTDLCPNQNFQMGERLRFYSISWGEWIDAVVINVRPADNAVQIDVKADVWLSLEDQNNRLRRQRFEPTQQVRYRNPRTEKWEDAEVVQARPDDGKVQLNVKKDYWFSRQEQDDRIKPKVAGAAYQVGDTLLYNSVANGGWIKARAVNVRKDCAIEVDVKTCYFLTVDEQKAKCRPRINEDDDEDHQDTCSQNTGEEADATVGFGSTAASSGLTPGMEAQFQQHPALKHSGTQKLVLEHSRTRLLIEEADDVARPPAATLPPLETQKSPTPFVAMQPGGTTPPASLADAAREASLEQQAQGVALSRAASECPSTVAAAADLLREQEATLRQPFGTLELGDLDDQDIFPESQERISAAMAPPLDMPADVGDVPLDTLPLGEEVQEEPPTCLRSTREPELRCEVKRGQGADPAGSAVRSKATGSQESAAGESKQAVATASGTMHEGPPAEQPKPVATAEQPPLGHASSASTLRLPAGHSVAVEEDPARVAQRKERQKDEDSLLQRTLLPQQFQRLQLLQEQPPQQESDVPPAQLQRRLHELLERAADLHQEQRPTEAAPLYRQALLLAPEHTRILHCLGDVLRAVGDLDGAEENLRCALDADGADVEALVTLGEVLEAHGQLDGADAVKKRVKRMQASTPKGPLQALRAHLEQTAPGRSPLAAEMKSEAGETAATVEEATCEDTPSIGHEAACEQPLVALMAAAVASQRG